MTNGQVNQSSVCKVSTSSQGKEREKHGRGYKTVERVQNSPVTFGNSTSFVSLLCTTGSAEPQKRASQVLKDFK